MPVCQRLKEKTRLSCTGPAHTNGNDSHIAPHNANSARWRIMPPYSIHVCANTAPSAAAKHHSGAVPPRRSLTGCLLRLSCSSEHQTRLRAVTEPDEFTVCATEARAGLPTSKSCINNGVIGHRSAASLCNPRSTIIRHCFIHGRTRHAWAGARCNFLIDPRRCLQIIRYMSLGYALKVLFFLHWIRSTQQ